MAAEKKNIFVVEDDRSIAELIHYNLQSEGYQVQVFTNGSDMFYFLKNFEEPISLFVLDVMLPGKDGFEICRQLKSENRFRWSSFLFLTARSTEQDKLQGFAVGADDFLTKPFGMRELLARVKVLVQRNQELLSLSEGKSTLQGNFEPVPDKDKEKKIEIGDILLDVASYRVFVKGKEVEVTHREFELLRFMMINEGLAFTRDDLLNHVWGYEYTGETRTVDVHIRQLRRKIEEDASKPKLIQTVRGVGYRFSKG